MAPRQLWIFLFGCWASIVSGLVHLAGHIAGPAAPANDTERQLETLATTYRFALPGGSHRTLMDFMDGFSLTFALLLVLIGALGIALARRGRDDLILMTGAARVLALGFTGLLVVTLQYFFIVPALFVALVAVSFAVASVGP